MAVYVRTCTIEDAQYCLDQAKSMLERARSMWSQTHQTVEKTKSIRAELHAQIEELAKRGAFRRRFTDNLLSSILDAAVEGTGANMGNIQLFDSRTRQLVIRVHRGFDEPFLKFFNSVHAGRAACGTALKFARRVVVPDVTNSPIFSHSDALEALLDAGIRSVQSTPLIAKSGRIWGMLSTHYRNVNLPGRRDLSLIDYFAEWAAEVLDMEFRADPSSATVFSGNGNGAEIPASVLSPLDE